MRRGVSVGIIAVLVLLVGAALLYAVKPKAVVQAKSEDRFAFILKNIESGGPPKDGIPAVDRPVFALPYKAPMDDDKPVFGVDVPGFIGAFPKDIMYWHEIVNFKVDDVRHSLTYCPLTGSAIGFLGHNLGVSGQLFNSNLVMYDRKTDALIPQMYGIGVNRDLKGVEFQTFPVVSTTWGRWVKAHPDTFVLTRETRYPRDYDRTPYSGYEDILRIWFPVTHTSDALHSKEVVLGIVVNDEAVAVVKDGFPDRYPDGLDITVGGKPVHVEYDATLDIIRTRKSTKSFEAFWFAWYAFYSETKLIQ